MSNPLIATPASFDEKTLNDGKTYFSAMNAKGLNWEGFAESKEELHAKFPDAIITEWEPTPFTGIWMY